MKATVEVVRAALGDALATGTGQVVLTVFREGQEPLGAALDPVTWGAVWDALALDPDDGAGEGQTP